MFVKYYNAEIEAHCPLVQDAIYNHRGKRIYSTNIHIYAVTT